MLSEEETLRCAAQIRVEILYLSEDGALCGVGYTIPANCELSVPKGANCRCRCVPTGEITAVPVTGGLEVRCEVLFSWVTTREERVPCVLGLKQGAAPASEMPKPSLVIRMIGEGETLWDVAKSCGATIRDIRTVNELADENPDSGTLLLIPTRRN